MSMHADEESDEGIVPMKRSNNGSLLPAEIVEGRASPKENGGQATAVRTPSRGAASSRLDAVRQAARQDKKVRFTALLHHITVDLLKQSYIALKRDAAPGTDGVTWQAYGENLAPVADVSVIPIHEFDLGCITGSIRVAPRWAGLVRSGLGPGRVKTGIVGGRLACPLMRARFDGSARGIEPREPWWRPEVICAG